MIAVPGVILSTLFRRFFAAVQFGDEMAARIRKAASRGPVVYVLGNRSYIDYLYFNYALRRFGLPLAQFVNGIRTLAFRPLRALFKLLGAAPTGRKPAERLIETLTRGEAACIFIRPPRGGRRGSGRGQDEEHREHLVEALCGLQAELARPIQLVPLVLIWGQRSARPGSLGLIDRVFGAAEQPGRLRAVLQFLRFFRSAVVKVPEPVDLREFLAEQATEQSAAGSAETSPTALTIRRLRFELSGRLERERRVVLGPPRKAHARLRLEVLGSRALRDAIDRVASESKAPLAQVEKRAAACFDEIAARVRPAVLGFSARLLTPVFNRIYDGLEVDEPGIERLRNAARQGPLIIVPSHKSHVDYLVLSYVFAERDLVPPHIAAGVNLSFFPLGFIFRSCGAFFIRRTMKGDKLYAEVLRAYLRKILREGYNVEFFIEGGRSRSGKLLPPKLGLLSMIADLALRGEIPGAQVVPVSIGYEKVIEEKSYAKELEGGEKKKEDMRGLLGVGGVLGSRYGRVNIQFDTPIAIAEYLVAAGAESESKPESKPESKTDEDAAGRRNAVQRLGHQISWGIGSVTALTPTALLASALLATVGRGIARAELMARILLLADRARARGVRLSSALDGPGQPGGLRREAIDRAITLLASDGDLEVRGAGETDERAIYIVPDDRRHRVDFYKNTALHHFAAESLLAGAALALARQAGPRLRLPELRRRTLEASRVLKLELPYRVGATFDTIFNETLDALVAAGWLVREPESDTVTITGGGEHTLLLYAGLTANLLEGYACAARALAALEAGAQGRKELLRAMSESSDRAFLLGQVKRREGLTRQVRDGAIDYFLQTGVLEEKDKRVQLKAPFTDKARRQAWVDDLAALVPEAQSS
jgi:glycerol-3-phosphate O-acyltransferase